MTVEEIRQQFPYLESGKMYLNHAATGPWSRYVEADVQAHIDGRARGSIDVFMDTMRIIGETRSMAAAMIGADPARLAFVQNTSEGLNVLAAGLDWKPGDRILLIDREFPSNVYPFLNTRRFGVEIDFVPQRDGRVDMEDVARAMTSRTRLVAVSWVQFLSGFRIDLAVLRQICDRFGALLSVDAIQGIGAVRLDLQATPVDFLSAGVQKWQLGPQGVAIIYVSARAQELISQSHMGWISVQNSWNFFDYDNPLQEDARRYENGTYNSIGITGYHGALRLFEAIGHDRVAQLVQANAEHTCARAREYGFEVITPEDTHSRAGIVTFRHEQADELQQHLMRKNIVVSARVGHVRISPHCYNTFDEIDAVLTEIRNFGNGG
ncbi:MAG: aminotransferase class V-fold PLP-dependent enzyme [Bacteroidetes bacterium]|nr:aminotransferase class V-fold PLP-dependent enzyme [Bacteroidota bacterium]